jgi:hypothetical protein
MGGLVQTALAESAAGAAAGVVADSLLYAIDSAKVRAQHKSAASLSVGNISILFRGLAPTVLLGSLPVFGSFFLFYAPLRVTLQERGYDQLLPLASAICAIPATVVGVPADVIKKRVVLGIDPSVRAAISSATAERGMRGLFAGWHVNLIRDLPFAGVKVGLYEGCVYEWKVYSHYPIDRPITSGGAAVCGVTSGVACAVLTCPLDVVNTRIKSGNVETNSILRLGSEILKKEGVTALFQGVALRSVVLGVGSSIFWPIQQSVSNWLQPYDSCPFLDDERKLSIFSLS